MSISGDDIYTTSTRIAGLEDATESDLRSAASRAYYAALHIVSAAVPAQFAPTAADLKKRDSHVAVVDALTLWANSLTRGRTEARYLSRNLPRLKQTRKTADYEIGQDFSQLDASEALALSEKIIASAKIAINQCAVSA